jgi:hypothetical protein
MEHLYVVSAGLTGFFLVMLGGKPRKARHDLLLAVWLVLLHLLVAHRSVAHPYTPWLEVSSALVFGHGPLLYAYTLALTANTPGSPLYGQHHEPGLNHYPKRTRGRHIQPVATRRRGF